MPSKTSKKRTVAPERTGWRDERISLRHRRYGVDCPALDIDFLLLEYDRGAPSAIVEYKHENARPVSMAHPSYRALRSLGDRADLPVFVVRYADDFGTFEVFPINGVAAKHLDKRSLMREKDWLSLLYSVRGRTVPQSVLDGLDLEM
jgi:hypothetical protein